MFSDWKDYFEFSKTERRGFIVLMIILFMILSARYWVANYYHPHAFVHDEEIQSEIERFNEMLTQGAYKTETKLDQDKQEESETLNPFPINPNEASEEELREFGFSERVVNNMLRYREAGGFFSRPDDIKRIFGFPDTLFPKIEAFIKIPDPDFRQIEQSPQKQQRERRQDFDKMREKERSFEIINLNTADSVALLTVSGIGPFRAERIIQKREALGGFIEFQQLTEVFTINDSVLKILKPQLKIDTSLIRKVNLNKAEFRTLVRHPYIDRNLANLIIRYREQHGNYRSVDEIKNLHLVNDELYRKIAPYLAVK